MVGQMYDIAEKHKHRLEEIQRYDRRLREEVEKERVKLSNPFARVILDSKTLDSI